MNIVKWRCDILNGITLRMGLFGMILYKVFSIVILWAFMCLKIFSKCSWWSCHFTTFYIIESSNNNIMFQVSFLLVIFYPL